MEHVQRDVSTKRLIPESKGGRAGFAFVRRSFACDRVGLLDRCKWLRIGIVFESGLSSNRDCLNSIYSFNTIFEKAIRF
jgi:hypothetical protein